MVFLTGLDPSDRVIIDGISTVRPGSKVSPQSGSIHMRGRACEDRHGVKHFARVRPPQRLFEPMRFEPRFTEVHPPIDWTL